MDVPNGWQALLQYQKKLAMMRAPAFFSFVNALQCIVSACVYLLKGGRSCKASKKKR
ncbi:hypothetical protein J2Z66_005579 [Paenibacillus eucommiae]|uniref:Transposase DDE domain-containing protein n=1 Tax=Paenibacillus eucommiae TaxID=1355755 RepID=A0ABS4J282_9BACL|nr:hypothetical protein [Paenibacillus eucommiae]